MKFHGQISGSSIRSLFQLADQVAQRLGPDVTATLVKDAPGSHGNVSVEVHAIDTADDSRRSSVSEVTITALFEFETPS